MTFLEEHAEEIMEMTIHYNGEIKRLTEGTPDQKVMDDILALF